MRARTRLDLAHRERALWHHRHHPRARVAPRASHLCFRRKKRGVFGKSNPLGRVFKLFTLLIAASMCDIDSLRRMARVRVAARMRCGVWCGRDDWATAATAARRALKHPNRKATVASARRASLNRVTPMPPPTPAPCSGVVQRRRTPPRARTTSHHRARISIIISPRSGTKCRPRSRATPARGPRRAEHRARTCLSPCGVLTRAEPR